MLAGSKTLLEAGLVIRTVTQFELEKEFYEPNTSAIATFIPQVTALPSSILPLCPNLSIFSKQDSSLAAVAASALSVVPVPLFFPLTSSVLNGFWHLGVTNNSIDAFCPVPEIAGCLVHIALGCLCCFSELLVSLTTAHGNMHVSQLAGRF